MHIGLNAHLLSSQPGYRAAGIHNVIHHLLMHLPVFAPDDWQFTAMTGAANTAEYSGMSMCRAQIDTESPAKRIIWEQVAQPSQLSDFDLLHAMAFVSPLLNFTPTVVTVYDLTFMRYPQRLSAGRRLYLRLFTELSCRRAKRITAISQSTADDLTELLDIPASKIDVTPLGYDTDIFKPHAQSEIDAFKAANGLPERFWLFVGTLEPRKNLTMLLEAYARLPLSERLPLILGGGKGWDYEPIFAAIEKLHLSDSIFLPGFIPADDLALWYNSAELFVYPSVFEGFGLPVLEAMACGTPILTSDASSLPEVAASADLCLNPTDVPVWTAALQRAFHDADWREKIRQAGLQKAQQFRWETTAQLTLASYQRAILD
ncbi:MAG: glycosyltransferase family 4 protein [Aggregatilineales bacterium]